MSRSPVRSARLDRVGLSPSSFVPWPRRQGGADATEAQPSLPTRVRDDGVVRATQRDRYRWVSDEHQRADRAIFATVLVAVIAITFVGVACALLWMSVEHPTTEEPGEVEALAVMAGTFAAVAAGVPIGLLAAFLARNRSVQRRRQHHRPRPS